MDCSLDAIPTNFDDADINGRLTLMAEESLADLRPSVPAAQVFRELRAKYGIPASESVS
jgi:hypothetical protein